jgi:chromosome segregation ATPase
MIGDLEADIQEETEALARSNKELEGAPAEGKAQIQNDIDRLTASLELARRELKALQDHLQRLTVEPQEESTRVAPKPASF